MEHQIKKNQIKYMIAALAATIFTAAAYSLPAETFFAYFAAGLFLIPTSLFVYIVHKMAGD